jgi:hypothetical protein
MRLTPALIVLATLLLAPWSAHAGTVRIDDWTEAGHFANNAPNGGGAFLATTTGGPLGNRTFMTFCLEFNERITLGNTFDYELSNNAMYGGTGGGPAGDPLSDATKWLYYQTASGTGGYQALVTQAGGDLMSSGSLIQQAIWYLEQERTAGQISSYAVALANLAISGAANVATGWAALNAAGHNIYAMNLENNAGVWKQDQIVWTFTPPPPPPSVPDGDASTLIQLIAVGWIGAIGYLFVGLPGRRRAA